MRVLVVGGAGYVGSELCARLASRGHEVAVMDLLLYGMRSKLALTEEFGDRISWFIGDICSDLDLPPVQADVCVNLAGMSSDPIAQAYPHLNWKWNVYGAARVAELCLGSKIPRLIYASSASVYHAEDFAADVELGEGAQVRPHWHYSVSKYAGEMASSSFHEHGRLDVVILRKGTVCGPSRRMRYDLMLNTMFVAAAGEKDITVDGGGGVYRPVLGMQDAVSAYVALIEADPTLVAGARPEVFNAVSENDKVINFANRAAKVFRDRVRSEGVKIGPPRLVQRSYRVSARKLAERLGWCATCTCESIFGSLVDLWLEKKLPGFGDPSCYNLQALNLRSENLEAAKPGGWMR